MRISLKSFTIILGIIGLLYIPLTSYYRYKNLTIVKETLKEVIKTRTRIPYYEFHLNEYDNLFYNEGRGMLTFFKQDITKSQDSISFSILTSDSNLLGTSKPIVYMGFNENNLCIDLIYSITKPGLFTQLLTLLLYFIEIFLIFICIYTYRSRLFEMLSVAYLIMITLLMAL
ncbi:hypothetical protein LZQ00_07320 [Sphingobacterium sp. SRCM116780]|uniref:hypothetical protein n=1 Tax=Sphingobacterium sp. SRCM116780 TaxID=2907623 RepID=UPI001F29281C|nr:hypothetical protein [Sphingobacterium sp. SRCM116780]UIR57620.1 hypothetical protein LZQ00_07320 [Sphingobacterium sp. SRCM116780]